MPIRDAQGSDLAEIVAIYNAAIPGRMATADTEPTTVAAREAWFGEFDPARRPLWVFTDPGGEAILGWLSMRSFYGRPAYHPTVEVGVYVHPGHLREGIGRALLRHSIGEAPRLGVHTLLGFVFAHNVASVALFEGCGFGVWGRLPRVAELDGVERDVLILGLRA